MVTSTGLHVGMSDEDGVVIFTDMHEGTHEAYFRNADYTHRMTVEFTVIKDDTVEIEVVFGDDTDIEDVTTTTEISSDETVTTTTSVPANIVDSDTCGDNGDNLTWTLDDEGTLIISGTGDMENYADDGSPWYKNKDIKAVMINEGVTSIGRYAFEGCSSLTSITIPDGVTGIGWNAFSGCSSLMSITIPDSVEYIRHWAFGDCDGLKSITIPDSVTNIDAAFNSCDNLESITIENPDCEIVYYYHGYAIPKTATIYGYSGSTAEAYAEKYGMEFVALDKPETISMIQEKPIEILVEEPVEVLAEEPTEILAEEPAEVLAEEPTEILAEEPTEVLVEEPTETADDTADDSYILLEPAIHSFTDLLPNTVYNYYIMYNNTDLDILFNPGNIQYVSQFITDENGNAEVDLGYTEITEEAVKFTVPASVSEKNYKLGDVNGDGMVDAVDASYILRIYAVYSTDGTPEETEEQLLSAEVNGDGSIDAVDAAIVLAYYAHLSTGGTDDIETFISNNIDNTQ